MSSPNGAYDQNLLDAAPAATRAQRQEGYNVDLLDERPTRPTSTQPLTLPQPIPSDTDVESSSLVQEKDVPGAATHASHPPQSFWRTRNGKITIFVIAIVVIGAIVGGAVGGTVGKISSNNNAPPSSGETPATSTSATNTDAGVAPDTSTQQPVSSNPATPTRSPPAASTT
ncbi:uncharacterized protein F5147DRAFT_771147 [Suillus discolor]|uniref:Uncharacterized protein n=1 Tax=Suillus discolor TaxID=1912936 RepID=A0A9P7JWJ1_9AGAM|nr:uncharacterized protein F5147DRAFT_771147 [Suillus discolor]KAG2112606.1 hypothetical protein F5147DRAFT_771147 [Suillus discolor]